MNWFDKAKLIGLACGLCGSLLSPVLTCTDVSCRNYPDQPTEQSQGFAGWNHPDQSIDTVSSYGGTVELNDLTEGG